MSTPSNPVPSETYPIGKSADPACGVAIIGAGPAGLAAAEALAAAGRKVVVFERMPSIARKLLMAGRGGLNLTHSEPKAMFETRYRPADARLAAALHAFDAASLRAWADGLGQQTFIGTSGRIFPQAMKASPLLRAWLRRLQDLGVEFRLRHDWQGIDDAGRLCFKTPEGEVVVQPSATVLALGGASWPRLGANGDWQSILLAKGVSIAPLQPSNCGAIVAWTNLFRDRFAGQPLKRITLRVENASSHGEAMITRSGIEGGAIYALSAALREKLAEGKSVMLVCDLKPDLSEADILIRLAGKNRKGDTFANRMRKQLDLSPVSIGLLQEHAARNHMQASILLPEVLAALIKAVPVPVDGLAGMERAISSAGGVKFSELDASFMLVRMPGVFVAGEMLDWDAPTGGYLLQACFSTGTAAAKGASTWLDQA